MQGKLSKVSDTLTPDLAALYKRAQNKTGLHRAIGLGIVSLAKRSFNDPALRPAPWAPKKDGSVATLRKSGTLAKSVRVTTATARSVTVGSDRRYAAIHQRGGRRRKMPARPYLPFKKDGSPTPPAVKVIRNVVKVKLWKKG